MVKKDKKVEKKVEEVVEEAKEEGVKVEVVSESKPTPERPMQIVCGHGNTGFCKFCGPLE